MSALMQLRSPLAMALVILLALSACVTNSPKDAERQLKLASLHYQIGVDALGKGLLPKAFAELMESDTIRPDQPAVLDALAYAWLLRGDLKKSEAFYLRALRHGAGAATQNNYASLLNRLQRYQEAEKAARISLDDPRYPNQDLAFINLGNALFGQKDYAAAIEKFQQARLFNPDNRLADLRLADAYARSGKPIQAQVLYEAIIRTQPESRVAVEGLIDVLMQQQRINAARDVLSSFSRATSSAADRAWAISSMNKPGQP